MEHLLQMQFVLFGRKNLWIGEMPLVGSGRYRDVDIHLIEVAEYCIPLISFKKTAWTRCSVIKYVYLCTHYNQ